MNKLSIIRDLSEIIDDIEFGDLTKNDLVNRLENIKQEIEDNDSN